MCAEMTSKVGVAQNFARAIARGVVVSTPLPSILDPPLEHTPSHNLSVDQVKTNTISTADDLVSVKEEEISHSEEEPKLESCCLSQDCVATTCD